MNSQPQQDENVLLFPFLLAMYPKEPAEWRRQTVLCPCPSLLSPLNMRVTTTMNTSQKSLHKTQPVFSTHETCIYKFTSLLNLICSPQINTHTCGHVQRTAWKAALPSCSRSYTVKKHPFLDLLSATFVIFGGFGVTVLFTTPAHIMLKHHLVPPSAGRLWEEASFKHD